MRLLPPLVTDPFAQAFRKQGALLRFSKDSPGAVVSEQVWDNFTQDQGPLRVRVSTSGQPDAHATVQTREISLN